MEFNKSCLFYLVFLYICICTGALMFKKKKTCTEFLSSFSINLLAFYHECHSLIGYATHVLFNYWPVVLEGEGSNCFSITQLVGQKRS